MPKVEGGFTGPSGWTSVNPQTAEDQRVFQQTTRRERSISPPGLRVYAENIAHGASKSEANAARKRANYKALREAGLSEKIATATKGNNTETKKLLNNRQIYSHEIC